MAYAEGIDLKGMQKQCPSFILRYQLESALTDSPLPTSSYDSVSMHLAPWILTLHLYSLPFPWFFILSTAASLLMTGYWEIRPEIST